MKNARSHISQQKCWPKNLYFNKSPDIQNTNTRNDRTQGSEGPPLGHAEAGPSDSMFPLHRRPSELGSPAPGEAATPPIPHHQPGVSAGTGNTRAKLTATLPPTPTVNVLTGPRTSLKIWAITQHLCLQVAKLKNTPSTTTPVQTGAWRGHSHMTTKVLSRRKRKKPQKSRF